MPAATEYLPRLRGQLVLDWDDPIFSGPLFVGESGAARKKLTDLVSKNSEDAVTWSVFRTLSRLNAADWLPHIIAKASFIPIAEPVEVQVELWKKAAPSRGRLLWLLEHLDELSYQDVRQTEKGQRRLARVSHELGRWRAAIESGPPERGEGIFEGVTELDACLSTQDAVIVVEAKYKSDLSQRTAWDPQRDQIARCLDAALDLAGEARKPYFLLATDDYSHANLETPAMAYETLLPRYRDDAAFRAARLPHRSAEELARLDGRIGWLSWADLVDTVLDHSSAFSPEQKRMLRDLVDYLRSRRLLHKGG